MDNILTVYSKKKRDEGVEGVEGASSATRQRRGRGRNRRNDLETWKRKRAAKSLVVARQRGRFCHVFVQNRYVGWSKNRKELFFRGRQEQSRDLFSEIFAALGSLFFQRTNELNIFFPLFLFSSNQRIKNSAVFENLRARLDGVPVRALRGDSQKARFEDVFVLGDPVRGLSKSTHEPRESEREREPRVFLPEGGKLSVRARHFRELVTSESVSHAVV